MTNIKNKVQRADPPVIFQGKGRIAAHFHTAALGTVKEPFTAAQTIDLREKSGGRNILCHAGDCGLRRHDRQKHAEAQRKYHAPQNSFHKLPLQWFYQNNYNRDKSECQRKPS